MTEDLSLPWYPDYKVLLIEDYPDLDLEAAVEFVAEELYGSGTILLSLDSPIYGDALAYMQGTFLAEDPPCRIDIIDTDRWKIRIGEYGVRWMRIVKLTKGELN